jgi:membrane AbrB-like protein
VTAAAAGGLRETAVTLAIGAVGASLFLWLGFPAAMLTGPALFVTLASLAGVPTAIPQRLRDLCFVVVGVGIGANVTPEVIDAVRLWPISLLALAVLTVVGILAGKAMLVRWFGYQPLSAFLAAIPGHLSLVLGLTADRDGDVPRVTLVQSLRVLFLTLFIPAILGLTADMPHGLPPPPAPMRPVELIALLLASGGLGLVFLRLRAPAPLLLAGIVLSTATHVAEWTTGPSPQWLTYAAFLVLGALIGTRFRGTDLALLRSSLLTGVAVTALMGALAAAFAFALAPLIDLSPALLLIAFAPGGLEAMIAMSVQLGLDPAFVTAHHVFRLLFLTALIPAMIPPRRAG